MQNRNMILHSLYYHRRSQILHTQYKSCVVVKSDYSDDHTSMQIINYKQRQLS